MTIQYDSIKVGDTLPPLELPPVDRKMLALFAGASGDHNAVHIDIDYARRAGMPDVFAHGMLSMAWLGRLLTQWVDQRQVRQFGVRFVGITHLGHRIVCTGRVVEKFQAEGEQRVRLEIQTANQYGEPRVVGDAVVSL
ncbi:MaoC family dehydratase [Paraburkholderia unamae]|uniref:Acyl dehydratase n=1 Tax=Paraburkholderia unamae TaxID=219649 RepID=A0ABX5KN48_9BURK|nr:MaoC family dehydratase [Paraburkholderia unamae]PVX83715.1 acyl dehydratase [Paraburkholderia unamae]RAR63861.1 acyl dehydratase [Paraburkholderia unamae]CAG9263198.1 Dehydratase [Paraburkholderia unamae]